MERRRPSFRRCRFYIGYILCERRTENSFGFAYPGSVRTGYRFMSPNTVGARPRPPTRRIIEHKHNAVRRDTGSVSIPESDWKTRKLFDTVFDGRNRLGEGASVEASFEVAQRVNRKRLFFLKPSIVAIPFSCSFGSRFRNACVTERRFYRRKIITRDLGVIPANTAVFWFKNLPHDTVFNRSLIAGCLVKFSNSGRFLRTVIR